jgi:hypothetical protein
MAILEYPSTLPGPEEAPVAPGVRGFFSNESPGFQTRNFSRDFTGVQTLTFFLSGDEPSAFEAFWKTQLLDGGRWFMATWPFMSGTATLARKFVSSLRWSHVHNSVYRVQAEVEFRGTGLDVTRGWVEDFAQGLDPYSQILGALSIFTIVTGPALQVSNNTATGVPQQIRRSTPNLVVRNWSVDFKIVTNLDGDPPAPIMLKDGAPKLALNVRSSTDNPPANRILLTLPEGTYTCSGSAPSVGVNYRFAVTFSLASDETAYVWSNLDTNSVVESGTIAGTHPPFAVNQHDFGADGDSGGTDTVIFDNVSVNI